MADLPSFATQGYFTLSDLDSIVKAINDLSLKVAKNDTFFYKKTKVDGGGSDVKSAYLNAENAGLDMSKVSAKLSHNYVIKHKFGQDFTEPPLVFAATETSNDSYTVHVENVTTTGCQIRVISIQASKALANTKKDKTEFVNILALGKTKD